MPLVNLRARFTIDTLVEEALSLTFIPYQVPNPDASQVNATTECVANCDQGDGSQAETDAYAACVQGCINDNYFTSGGTPQATAGSGSGSSGSTASGSSASATSTSGSGSSDDSSATSGSGSTSTSSSSSESASASGSAADSVKVGMTGLGLLGFIVAAIAM